MPSNQNTNRYNYAYSEADEEERETESQTDGLLNASPASGRRKSNVSRILAGLLVISLAINVFLAIRPLNTPSTTESPSKYAKLTREITEPLYKQTHYSSNNDTLQTKLWHDIDIDAGVVALSDSWAAEHGLRTAQRFPWDESKGIYILHGFHNLHCLKIIHMSLDEYRQDRPQSRNWHHVSHCLDALRRQVICDADDTPRAMERRKEVASGVGQHRQCRSWEALEAFARKHTACYKRPENPEDGKPVVDRYKHCPPDSGYTVREGYVPDEPLVEGLPEESLADPDEL